MMTDNEIIKALELCGGNTFGCNGCPYNDKGNFQDGNCSYNNAKDAVDLINRQKAELEKREKHIEELNEQIEHLVSINGEAEAEIEDVKRRCDVALSLMQRKEECIKAEAIKEFAGRLKEKVQGEWKYSAYFRWVIVDDMDNLVKEMVGEANGSSEKM